MRTTEAHLHWKAEAHRLAAERDEAQTEIALRTMMTKAAVDDRDEARAIARRLAEALNCYANLWQGHCELLAAFDAMPWAKEPA